MKRLTCILLAVCVIASLAGCRETGQAKSHFPLTEEAVTAALERTGLPGVISESETQSDGAGRVAFTLHDQTENKKTTMLISSGPVEEDWFLQIYFISPSASEQPPFAWEDWKQQLVFAALLYGGFSDEEEIYRAFSEQEAAVETLPPDPETQKYIAESRKCDARLPGGYCRLRYQLANTSIESSSLGTVIMEQAPRMEITIYGSESQYQKIQQEMMERKEAMETASAEEPR